MYNNKLITKFLFIGVLLSCSIAVAQETPSAENKQVEDNNIYNTAGIEKKPEFPGGFQAFYNYVNTSYKIPNVPGLKGKVMVTFVIEKDGSVNDIKVLRDLGNGTGEEAVRVLKECPKWIPGEQDGKKVRVLFALPIVI